MDGGYEWLSFEMHGFYKDCFEASVFNIHVYDMETLKFLIVINAGRKDNFSRHKTTN